MTHRAKWAAPSRRSVCTPRRVLAAILLGLLLGLAAGAGCNWLTGPHHPARPKQGLVVQVNRHLAVLLVNDKPMARLSARMQNVIGLAPGTYRVAVRKAGFFTRYFDVTVRKGAFVHLDVRLPAELD